MPLKNALKHIPRPRRRNTGNNEQDKDKSKSSKTEKAKRRGIRKFRGGATNFNPMPGEAPLAMLRVQVVSCKDLLSKDRNGFSDPFVTVSLLNHRHQTPSVKRTLQPVYASKDATFDFPIYLSLADKIGVLELVVWDKDVLRKDYLGEVSFPFEDWFGNNERPLAWDEAIKLEDAAVVSIDLVSTRAHTSSQGSIQVKLGFVHVPGQTAVSSFSEVFQEMLKRSRPSLVSAPPTQGIGTVRSHSHGPEYEDDGGLSSESDSSDYDDDDDTAESSDEEGEDEDEDESVNVVDDTSHVQTPTASNATSPTLSSTIHTPVPRSASSTAPDTPTAAQTQARTPSSGGADGAGAVELPHLNLTPASPIGSATDPIASLDTAMGGTAPPSGSQQSRSSPSPRLSGMIPRIPKFPKPKRSDTSSSQPDTPDSPTAVIDLGADISATPEEEKAREEKKKRFRKSWGSRRTSGNIPTVGSERTASESSSGSGSGGSSGNERAERRKERKERSRRKSEYSFGGQNDIVGIVMLEIQSASDLPRLKNMTRTGWDMDPFIVISFGKKVFRTRVIRHSLNPVWDEKLLFHVRRYETSFEVQLAVLDWDKLSSNDHIGDARFEVKELVDSAPQPDPETGLYPIEQDEHPMKDYSLPLSSGKATLFDKHSPSIKFRAKYQPYAALRQRFWYQYLKQYDTDDTMSISHLELTSMLDSLGSTLTNSTINSFFTRFNKQPHQEELTYLETIQCLETELGRPDAEKKRVDEGGDTGTSVSATPIMMASDSAGKELKLEDMDFSGPPMTAMLSETGGDNARKVPPPGQQPTEPSQQPLLNAAALDTPGTEYADPITASSSDLDEYSSGSVSPSNVELLTASSTTATTLTSTSSKKSRFRRGMRKASKTASKAASSSSNLVAPSESPPKDDNIERVINVKNCPLCHRPRLNSKAEVDIVTHLAVCASQDWNKVDRIVVGNFVTASQAQRKWYTKILGKVSAGDYRLGANSANIIIQNRITGQLEEEKMQVYVRLGIRLLYKGMKSRMEGGRARRLLKSLSIKQGIKYDSPDSAKDIPGFIEFHGLNMDEVLDPLESFKTFNEFFYRKLKPEARPVEELDNPYRLVSAADCRMMAFESVNEATRLWIKGREFTVARLLGDAYKDQADRYNGGALAIFRLAPQDYHRFHSPVDGVIGPMTYIAGEYYTVNPQAIRTALDVYGENARKIVPIDSPQFGRVMAVCVGAMMVGTIQTTVEEGQAVKRGEEFGYFAFGGSTIVILFEPGTVEWDEDLLINGRASLETLVRVGMGIGRGLRQPIA
ncbi:phosphatidylserine decarboxylase [Moniliophthora roreri MCA 2997]|uniref:Phosphatidylserine decarboxylase proenzyme 2 n=1 Tax=Moniliophthora roreri (strain MCA 2997) TaxID=1381753 RepID=V2X6Y6_MONRO|nr:phosphatidylserine decarboxylase [Moniliophthora roreri MCA 2997]